MSDTPDFSHADAALALLGPGWATDLHPEDTIAAFLKVRPLLEDATVDEQVMVSLAILTASVLDLQRRVSVIGL